MSLYDVMAIRDPIYNTPLVPELKMNNYGAKKKKSKTSRGHIYRMAKAMKVKISSRGKKKSVRKLWSDIYSKGKSILNSGKPTKYLTKHIKIMSKKLKIKMGGKSQKTLWNQINTNVKKYLPKKRKRKNSSFGWWDNTQRNYCIGNQCSNSTLDNPYPFYLSSRSEWKPYVQLRQSF